MVVRALGFMGLLFSGCWVGPSDIGGVVRDTDDTDDMGEPQLHIAEISPAFGPSTGGVELSIHMVEPCEAPVVRLGGVEATVLAQSELELTVEMPVLQGGQWVDLSVACEEGLALTESAFQVFIDAQGLTRSTGELSWVTHIGQYWTDGVEDYGYVSAYLFQPLDFEYSIFYGREMDRCESGYSFGSVSIDSMASLTDTLTLRVGSTQMDLWYDSATGRYERKLSVSEYRVDAHYDLDPIGETAPWSEASVASFVQTPPGTLSITKPPMDDLYLPEISATFDLVWPGAGQGDFMVAMIDRYDDDGSFERVRCLLTDDGHFRVTADVFRQWASGETMLFRLGRAKRADGVFAQDNAGSGMVGIDWVMGAGYQE
jgi:hypothetical protein